MSAPVRLLVAVAVALTLVGIAPAPPAQAWCGDGPGIQTYPCVPKPHWPSIPRFNMGGPRPPLTPKNDVWCTANMIWSNVRGVAWYRAGHDKKTIRFWPDYYHNSYVTVVQKNGGWVQASNPVWTSTDCDA